MGYVGSGVWTGGRLAILHVRADHFRANHPWMVHGWEDVGLHAGQHFRVCLPRAWRPKNTLMNWLALQSSSSSNVGRERRSTSGSGFRHPGSEGEFAASSTMHPLKTCTAPTFLYSTPRAAPVSRTGFVRSRRPMQLATADVAGARQQLPPGGSMCLRHAHATVRFGSQRSG